MKKPTVEEQIFAKQRQSVESAANLLYANGKQVPPRLWTPFERSTDMRGGIAGVSPNIGRPEDSIHEVWVNNLYQVHKTWVPEDDGDVVFIHLSYKAQDGTALHDWRDMQRIKNELTGPEWLGIEVFPPESKLVDTANQFHIWCFKDLDMPFMFPTRLVSEGFPSEFGSQRPWPMNEKPADLISADGMRERLVRAQQNYEKRKEIKQ